MTPTAEVHEIGSRRLDIARYLVGPQASAHHRLAAFITENDLPDASITVSNNGRLITVGATHTELPENVVRRWAQALEAIVTETPHEWQDAAATLLTAEASLDGTYYRVSAFIPVEATA